MPCKYKCSKLKWNMYLRPNRFSHLPRPRNKKKIHQQFQVNDTSISQSTTDTLKSLPKLSHWMKTRSLATNGSHWINIFIRAQFKTFSIQPVSKETRKQDEYKNTTFTSDHNLSHIFVSNDINKTKIVTFIVTKVSDSDTNMLHDCYCSCVILQ